MINKYEIKLLKILTDCSRIGFAGLLLLPFIFAIYLSLTATSSEVKADTGRLILLGFDGMDFDLTSEFLANGDLPNLKKLSETAVFSPLNTSNPAESPVAWSSMVTGTNPGKTGIFDFLRRNPKTYFPELNMTDVITPPEFLFDQIPVGAPVLENQRKGPAFWEYAGNAGIKTYGISMPMNMPADQVPNCHVLSGLGVPDMRKTMGTYVYYVADRDVASRKTGSTEGTEMGGRVIELERDKDNPNKYVTILPGPYDPVHPDSPEELSVNVTIDHNPSDKSITFTLTNEKPFGFMKFAGGLVLSLIVSGCLWLIFGLILKSAQKGFLIGLVFLVLAFGALGLLVKSQTKSTAVIKEREWSDWMSVSYKITDLVGAVGYFKVYFIESEPNLQIYVTPVNIDPRGTLGADVSWPIGYSKNLLDKYGYFKMYGWDSETWALNENVIDDQTYIDDLMENFEIKSNMALTEMKEQDWQLFSAVFFVTDHIQHMFYRTIDPEHPMYSEEIAALYGNAIRDVFHKADELVGKVMNEVMRPGDELIIISDHGFNSFRYSVNLNRWLVDKGYLAEKNTLLGTAGGEHSSVYELFKRNNQFFGWVDWSKSKAYALGLGQIYINLVGREAKGIVTEAEYDALVDEIIAELKELKDPTTGERMMINVYRADEIYHGDNMKYAPDIVVGFADGYRVSWQTTLGVAAEDLLEVNMRKWSGDHCSFDPSITRGVLFSTIPIKVEDPQLMDITPSMLYKLGLEIPERIDGRNIF